jgi:hypothetical protein
MVNAITGIFLTSMGARRKPIKTMIVEATALYTKISPFAHAHKINEPILLIHGEADNNTGTFPIQSEHLFQAIKGNGGTARLVMPSHESHGYRARESVLHVVAEMLEWADRYVKNRPVSAGPGATTTGPSAPPSRRGLPDVEPGARSGLVEGYSYPETIPPPRPPPFPPGWLAGGGVEPSPARECGSAKRAAEWVHRRRALERSGSGIIHCPSAFTALKRDVPVLLSGLKPALLACLGCQVIEECPHFFPPFLPPVLRPLFCVPLASWPRN